MKQKVKTSEKIMLEAKAYTGWNFVGAVKGSASTMRADLTNEAGKKIKVIMEIAGSDVLIQVIGMDDSFDAGAVESVHEKLKFPVEAELKDGQFLIISYHEPLGVLEHSVKGVFKECIIPMVELMAGMLEE